MPDLINEIDVVIIVALIPASVGVIIGTPMGAFTGFTIGLICCALSAPLSPLIIGSITAVVSVSVPLIWLMSKCNGDPDSKSLKLLSILFTIPQVAIGIGLSAAINAISGTMLSINSAIILGTVIGFAMPVLTMLAAICLLCINECIVKPTVEKVKECFSSQENNSSHSSHITQSNNNKDTLQVDSVEQLENSTIKI